MKKQKIICIVGPTGSGKSSTAVRLAKIINGEIISADSMQIYKELNIGTAKVTEEEIQGVPHFCIDIVDPTEPFSVSDWKSEAEKSIDIILSRGKTPIIAGGTGLYVNALINNFQFFNVDETLRNKYIEKYNKLLAEEGVETLYQRLVEIDPEFAKNVDKNKTRAIINYLASFEAGAKNLKVQDDDIRYDYLLIGLDIDREIIYDRINKRVDGMIEDGLIAEIEGLIKKYNFNKDFLSASGIGYKEYFDYETGNITYERFLELVKQHSRNYAKRQFTYMKKMRGIEWIKYNDFDGILERVQQFLKGEN